MMHELVLKCSRWMRIALGSTTILACVGIWYVTVFYPLKDRQLRLQAQLDGLLNIDPTIVSKQEEYTQKQMTESQHQRELLQNYQAKTAVGIWLQQRVDLILSLITKAPLSLTSCTIQSDIPKDWRTNYYCCLHLKGTVAQLCNLFESMKNAPQLWACKKCSVNHVSGDQYTIDATITLYFIQEPQDIIPSKT